MCRTVYYPQLCINEVFVWCPCVTEEGFVARVDRSVGRLPPCTLGWTLPSCGRFVPQSVFLVQGEDLRGASCVLPSGQDAIQCESAAPYTVTLHKGSGRGRVVGDTRVVDGCRKTKPQDETNLFNGSGSQVVTKMCGVPGTTQYFCFVSCDSFFDPPTPTRTHLSPGRCVCPEKERPETGFLPRNRRARPRDRVRDTVILLL